MNTKHKWSKNPNAYKPPVPNRNVPVSFQKFYDAVCSAISKFESTDIDDSEAWEEASSDIITACWKLQEETGMQPTVRSSKIEALLAVSKDEYLRPRQ